MNYKCTKTVVSMKQNRIFWKTIKVNIKFDMNCKNWEKIYEFLDWFYSDLASQLSRNCHASLKKLKGYI